ncbi:unnamed protein product, partial [Lepidochelys kempii]
SYTSSSWVLTLAPSPHGLLSPGTADLACVVHGVSNPVQISWSFSGDLQEHGLMHSLKAKDGSFVFINHISVPVDTWTSGKIFTCDVKFNSSGKSVKKIARYIEAPASKCSHYIVPLAAGAGLLLLVVSLSLVRTLCPSTLGLKPRISAPPASEEPQRNKKSEDPHRVQPHQMLGVQLFLYQTQQIQFVEVNGSAEIHCSSKEKMEGDDMFWYLRREGEKPICIKYCLDNLNVSKFACKHERHSSTLEINNIQKNETGVYYCAFIYTSYLIFGNGSTLIVGDSYTNSSWVMLLVPFPHGSQVTGTANLACVIHGVSNPVHVSWSVSGELQEQGLMRSLKAKDGLLTLINHISVPMDTWTSGKIFMCEVKFNSSGKSVKKSTRYPAASSTTPARECSHYIAPLAAGAGLLLLVVSLSLIWTLCPSTLGFQPRVSAPPASEEPQGGILYAHLDFDSQNRDGRRMQPSARGKGVKP